MVTLLSIVRSWSALPALEQASRSVLTCIFYMLQDVKAQLPLLPEPPLRSDISMRINALHADRLAPPHLPDLGSLCEVAVNFCDAAWPSRRKKSMRMSTARKTVAAAEAAPPKQ